MSAFSPIPSILMETDEGNCFSSEEIVVLVGPGKKCFHAHAAVLRENSPYFETALTERWLEGRSRVVEMVDDDEEAFNTYMNWLYRTKICLDMPQSSKSTHELDLAWTRLFRSYALGDKLMDSFFKDGLTDAAAVCVTRTGLPSVEVLHTLYESTLPDAPMRLLMVCELARREDQIKAIDDTWPYALTIDLVKLLKSPKECSKQPTLQMAYQCHFHEHKLQVAQALVCHRYKAHEPKLVMQYLRLSKHDITNFATRSIHITTDRPSATFTINERLLRVCQPALEFSVEPGNTGARTLKVDSGDRALDVYLNWLCSGKMYIDFFVDEAEDEDFANHEIWVTIAHAYDLGGRLPDSSFRDALTDAVALMFEKHRYDDYTWAPVLPETLSDIYQLLDADSGLCKLIAYALAGCTNLAELMSDEWPSKALHAVGVVAAKMLHEGEKSKTLEKARKCGFHEHGTDECYRRNLNS